jgi:hypothetical protein
MMIEQGRDESMQDTAEEIPQLSTATASYRGTVATLTTTNAKLATQLEAAHAQIANNKQRQLLLVAWLRGGKIAHECDMQHEKERTSGCGEQEQHHGWIPMGQGMMQRGS